MQIGDVFVDDHAQHAVGFMQDFLQMLGAFFIDGPGHKRKVLYAKTDKTHYRQQNGGIGQPFARQAPFSFSFTFYFHTAYPNVI